MKQLPVQPEAIPSPRLIVVMDKGAVDDVEALRLQLLNERDYVIEVNPGRSLEIFWLSGDAVRVQLERGAVDDVAKMRAELARRVGIVVVNPGRQFKLLE